MKKIKKIKIKINGKIKSITQDSKLSVVLKNLKIPLNKVAIELNFLFAIIKLSFFNLTTPYKMNYFNFIVFF